MKKVYLDYVATTPVDPLAVKEMAPYFSDKFGNTMSLYSLGREAKKDLEESRKKIASLISADPEEIFFTSSATESNNTILKGIKGSHMVISSIEHACIMESALWLEKQGARVTRIPVDKFGLVNPLDIEKAITKDTALVSIIHGSNEVGTIQDIGEIGRICREKNVLFHTDASQTFGKIKIDVENIDLLSASSHKIYGPKGAGIIFKRKGVDLTPLIHGGGQEEGLRSSTVNVPSIVGFAKACQIAEERMEKDLEKISRLFKKLVQEVLKIDNVYLTGHPEKRLKNIASFYFSFIEGESLVLSLDLEGIAVSTGSACSSRSLEPSHVLIAMGLEHEQAHGSLRVSLGRNTTEGEIDYFVDKLKESVNKLRKISPLCIQKK
ncbi:MAG: cysteine desulfurase NifS [Candidatus Nealsonbacteria bacterium RIFOXYB1_FULL_40_15]|uniref:cysteine desulfurase n=2 Tax=Candidatus Nealsoniibacteriota TaxID=1817911 RepID=A0A1G2ERS1_9BACT|nr:MAG: cysteine desulfurase NifS [Candidatus Nealsonbacteria bacterium RIFOXYB1_FULL_40_15]OGZ28437.1 MAG: cysteine desulfurase NifS [Candidatus Nealsonbacteria bacterium RIFOXYC1_FULL_40_7]OGZ29847.1 MAG: cysteine desulfurase NifS [Candidatus Nealsonbacteria bacterium RIFOXYD1_FULL_39_11]